MNVEHAAVILASTILLGLSLCFLSVVIIILNNLFSRFWMPIKWLHFIDIPPPPPPEPETKENDTQRKHRPD